MSASVLDLALDIAAQGLPVFPCSRSKMPCICKKQGGRGFHDASTDAARIREMFAHRHAFLVGVPTGERSGFDVLDLDYRHGAREFEETNLHRIPETRKHQTQSGGRHLFFIHAPGVRNLASKFAPGVDVRGEGGFIIMPPSPEYSVISDAPVAHWPDWLLKLVLPRPREFGPPRTASHRRVPAERLEAIIESALRRVHSAVEGQKHFVLRNSALLLGGIQDRAGFSTDEAIRWLTDALPRSVRNWENAKQTAAWGLEQGRARPLDLVESERRQETGPRRKEAARDAFRLLRRGLEPSRVLATLHARNQGRSVPLAALEVEKIASWAIAEAARDSTRAA